MPKRSGGKSKGSRAKKSAPARGGAGRSQAPRSLAPDHAEEQLAREFDDAVPSRGYRHVPIVGLGGSAGSISAMREFFQAMPPDSGMAFVVVLHLAAEHESILSALIQRTTAMPVTQVAGKARVEPNQVYVIPPGQVSDLDRRLPPPRRPRGGARQAHGRRYLFPHAGRQQRPPCRGDRPVRRGRRRCDRHQADQGARRAHRRSGPGGGGVSEHAADRDRHGNDRLGAARRRHAGAPRASTARSKKRSRCLPKKARSRPLLRRRRPTTARPRCAMRSLSCARAPGRDFSYYKRATILRRVARRMQVNSVEDLPAYLTFLRTHAGEADALLQDLLISVTNFFRDHDAFAALGSHLPRIFDVEEIRTISCGSGCRRAPPARRPTRSRYCCPSTARSAGFSAAWCRYSRPTFTTKPYRPRASGLYPDAIAADVSEERLRRFFAKEANGYRVRREIREMVMFAVARSPEGFAVLAARPDFLPQPADLPGSQRPGPRFRDLQFLAAIPAGCCSSACRNRRTRSRTSARSTRSSGSTCIAAAAKRALPMLPGPTSLALALRAPPVRPAPVLPGPSFRPRQDDTVAVRPRYSHDPVLGGSARDARRLAGAAVHARERRARDRAPLGEGRPVPAHGRRRAVAQPAAR